MAAIRKDRDARRQWRDAMYRLGASAKAVPEKADKKPYAEALVEIFVNYREVTMCTENWVKRKAVAQFQSSTREYYRGMFMYAIEAFELYPIQRIRDLQSQMNESDITREEVIFDCRIGVTKMQDCCADLMSHEFFYKSLKCWTLDVTAKRGLAQESEGIEAGINIVTRQERPVDGMCGLSPFFLYETTAACDWRVYVSPEGAEHPIRSENLVINAAESAVEIAVERSVVEQLPPPYTNCIETLPLQYFPTYERPLCQLERLAQYLLQFCGCLPFAFLVHMDANASVPLCTLEPAMICVRQAYANANGALSENGSVSDGCPPQCHNTLLRLNANQRGGRINFQALLSNNEDEWLSQVAQMGNPNFTWSYTRVYYGRLLFSKLVESPILSSFDLFSKIGAALSLWLGLRVMSFLQFAYFSAWALSSNIISSDHYRIESSKYKISY